ncbi:hypothetical protein APR04_002384 [Promicromonospora umidemergens]|uniref:ATP-binding protein n=1 Tax=Promicromonospora umidemergens TaxID=629679 RepID=A0ABP8WRW3_9MICO|nr:ATP-binding protein [Promicromonospora umidemergens]MCP2283476.1 hypothetical protein [Promicromonospora umidemergens]
MTHDPFGTGALRRAVTEAWRASPTRFREDANSEEDHARGYYRDRVVVELAQNAADAAARAGVPGRLVLRLEPVGAGWRLVATNTGAPLDADGVASLASLRASAKTGELRGAASATADVVGRFGVGFAAVRSVSDEVLVRSRDGGVRFSLAATRAELDTNAQQPADLDADAQQPTDLGREVRARGAALPVLRLPFSAPGTAPDEPDTVVELLLRDADAVAAVGAQLAALDDALLLALPALDEVVIEDHFAGQLGPGSPDSATPPPRRVLRDVGSRWRVHRASGVLDLDESLPSEARRPDWSVLWALPTTGGRVAESSMLHAPTPTDVRLTFPALLIASFPVDPGRRGVLPGPTSDRVAAEAGLAYAAFLGELGAEREVLGLVPTGLPASDVDAAVRASADNALRDTPLLRPCAPDPMSVTGAPDPTSRAEDAVGATQRVAPRDAAFLTGPLGEAPTLIQALAAGAPAALVTVPVRYQALARSLGADPVDLADLVEVLPPDPGVVRNALAALAPHAAEPTVLEAVAGAPLPLADGRVARGPRGTVLLDAPHLAGIARALGVRVVHPDAAHPLLERAGAAPTTPRGLLADPAVRSTALAAAEDVLDDADAEHLAAVLSSAGPTSGPVAGDLGALDDPTPAETVSAVLELVQLAAAEPGADLPFWLGELPVAADGDVVPLREAALPGTWAAQHLDLALVRDDVVGRWGLATLVAAGARADLGVYRVVDVVASDEGDDVDYGPDDPAGWLSDWDEYLEHLADELGPGAWVGDVAAVPDLDALRDATDAAQGPLAAALGGISAEPELRRALLTPVRSPDSPGREALSYTAWFLRGRLGGPFALGDTPLLPSAPPETVGLGANLLSALGGLHDLADLPGHEWPKVLERLPETRGRLSADVARAVWTGLAALARADDVRAIAPARLPALGPTGLTVESTDDLAVAATPRWAQLGPVVPAPADVAERLADLLDLPYEGHSDLDPDEPGEPVELDPRVRALAPDAPTTWRRHDALTVDGTRVAWWVSDGATDTGGPGVAHATSPEALARALAELTGADMLLLEAALRDPARAEELSAERAWG